VAAVAMTPMRRAPDVATLPALASMRSKIGMEDGGYPNLAATAHEVLQPMTMAETPAAVRYSTFVRSSCAKSSLLRSP